MEAIVDTRALSEREKEKLIFYLISKVMMIYALILKDSNEDTILSVLIINLSNKVG